MNSLAFIPLMGPVALALAAGVAFAVPGAGVERSLRTAWRAAAINIGVAAAAGVVLWLYGPMTSSLLGVAGVGISIRLDSLSVSLYGLVSFVGLVVIRYSQNYLSGDARHAEFAGLISLTLSLVCVLVTAGNLVQLVVSWIGTSLALHKLLVFYPERPRARLAARKKFIVARASDVCLAVAAGLIVLTFGTTDIGTLSKEARALAENRELNPSLVAATLLLVAAAVFKSAQFPFHAWLVEAMETPTPVSALLHAGIINAGGFLIVRFADVMLLNTFALHTLALAGLSTAVIGSVVMVTQTSVKGYLAWSTVAQMGFMLLQCGFGAFTAAVIHIVGHSLYKAHAFLNSGSAVETVRKSVQARGGKTPALKLIGASMFIAVIAFSGAAAVFGTAEKELSSLVAFGSVVVLSLVHFQVGATSGTNSALVFVRTTVLISALSIAYFAIQSFGGYLLADAFPRTVGYVVSVPMVLAAVGLGLLAVIPQIGGRFGHSGLKAMYVHASNGFYVNAYLDRLFGAWRMPREHETTQA